MARMWITWLPAAAVLAATLLCGQVSLVLGDAGCIADADCPGDAPNCILGLCRSEGLSPGSDCATDSDCLGYCELLKCRDGSSGDPCGKNSDCQGDLTCTGVAGFGATCTAKGPEGADCGSDADCLGYCELLKCRDGSSGDPCGKNSDCQGSLTCQGVAGFGATCTAKKPEGAGCSSDSDCLGYCEIGKCWNGSKGDRCGSTRDCQGSLKCKRKERCRFGVCVPVQVFRTCR